MLLPLLPPAAKYRCEVTDVEGLVQHKHVTLGEPGLRSVTLFQDHYCVPHVAVRKVNLGVGPIWIPTQTPLYRALDPQQMFQERYPISLGLPGGGGGGGCPSSVPLNHTVLDVTVRQQLPQFDLNSALREFHPTSMLLLKVWSCPRRPHFIRLHQHLDRRVTWLASYAHCLLHIRPEADRFKEAGEDVGRFMQPLRLG